MKGYTSEIKAAFNTDVLNKLGNTLAKTFVAVSDSEFGNRIPGYKLRCRYHLPTYLRISSSLPSSSCVSRFLLRFASSSAIFLRFSASCSFFLVFSSSAFL